MLLQINGLYTHWTFQQIEVFEIHPPISFSVRESTKPWSQTTWSETGNHWKTLDFFFESQKLETPHIKPKRMDFFIQQQIIDTAMFPTSPYNVSLVSPTSSGWAPSSFTTPQQQQSIGSSASWTHEFKGVPLRCGWYHSGRTAVPSLKSHFFLRGRKTLDPHNSDQVLTKDTKYRHLDNLFLQVHLGVQSLLPSHIFASQPI